MSRQRGNFGALTERLDDLKVVWKLIQDDQVDTALKLIPLLAALYVLFPIDLIPDLFIGVGQLDDVGLVLLALTAFLRLAPPERVARARRAVGQRDEEIHVDVRHPDEER